ncbi:efflux RND transporter periplasmic adaptor subunit [Bacteroides coprosuis]|uniref:efflux RND transporter periplasmic adaptor subunit n=1 Tax=Bacteroides coprosuis TaxID=151276 RepID=UPI001D78CD67|nr:HlyD family efflux transporter periplasmic adaptor subunit [Bacteroides coprosuis]HJD91070.1 HlyD family efflux transporter periplasmic adaptor subunit [Bacteroides coprosuis]
MDIQLKKKKFKKKYILWGLVGLLFFLFMGWLILGNHNRKFKVKAEYLTINEAIAGEFNNYIRISGQVQPINTIQLSAIEGGIVEEKLVEEGSMVKSGDIIVRLSNPNLSLSILDSEAQLAEKQNFLRNTQVTMEQERLRLRQEKLQLDLDVDRKRRRYEQYNRLYSERLVSKEEYIQAKEDYDFAVRGRELVMDRQMQDSIYRGIQVENMEESLHNMRRNMHLVRQRSDNLNIKAPVDGQLGLLDIEVGQNVVSGSKIGQISVLSDFKVEALIDEHYIDRVKSGLDASFERQETEYELRVRKVYPEVREKQFKTDFVFVGERPSNIRTGQTYYINLQLGQPSEAILVPRGAFYQATGGQWIFVVSPDGKRAVRRKVSIGRQNPVYYEVTGGLESGEKVITSTYADYEQVDELIIE